MRLTIDFETRSEADLQGQGIWMYATHPSTEILCMAIKIDEEPTRLWIPDKFLWVFNYLPPLEKAKLNLLIGDEPSILFFHAETIEGHNVSFENAIYNKVGLGPDFPPVPNIKWRCSAAKAAAMGLPRSLDAAGRALNLTQVKDKTGYFNMLKMCKPRKPTKTNKAKWNEDPLDFLTLYKYCMQDVNAEHALSAALRDLTPREQKIWMADQTINQRGLYVDTGAAAEAIKTIERYTIRLKAEFKSLTGVEGPTMVAKTLDWLKHRGYPLKNLTKETVAKAIAKIPDWDEDVRRVLEIRQSLSKSSTAKFRRMVIGAGPDGRMRDTLMYCGAERTGRWAGRRVQVHNMPRDVPDYAPDVVKLVGTGNGDAIELKYGDPMVALSGSIRSFIRAAPGKDLLCADYVSVEGMILAWLARENYVIRNYENKLDPYIVFASQISGEKYDAIAEGKKAGVKKYEDIRFKGKTGELACGYQGGEKAIYRFAPQMPVEERKEIVKIWRDARPKTVEFWKIMESHAKAAIHSGKTFTWHNIKWGVHKDFLHCKLPSGRLLSYYRPELVKKKAPWGEDKVTISFMGIDSNTKQFSRQYAYGGKLVENITQATARDILAEALVRLEMRGYPVVLHVHDEAIAEVPVGTGSVEEFCKIMTERPAWAADCPIAAEGFRTKLYKKG